MSSEFGNALKVSVFGQSHGRAIGVTVDGFPSGEAIDVEALQAFLDRRRPGTSELTTARNETDCPEFLSGVTEDGDGNVTTCGFPLTAVIKNKDQHSSDYSDLLNKPRPSHADYTAFVKYGEARDMRGGGHFSGRLTAPLCIAGGICLQMLARRGIHIGAHLERVGEVLDEPFPLHPDEALFEEIRSRNPATIDPSASLKMIDEITNARFDNDSVGGIIECAVTGFPAGVGGPMFDGIESELAKALFGIPAIKGVEFGNGFTAAELRGSQNNDAFIAKDGTVETETNRSGGIQGGIS
ncbi:MAG: chorismate synthase, partial [Clostridia bacterium]|nr:chorismate synthase [Clostridia bacterium]